MWMSLCCSSASHRKQSNFLDASFSPSAKQPSCLTAEVASARCSMEEILCGDSIEPFTQVPIKTLLPPSVFLSFLCCSFPSLPAHLFPGRLLTHQPQAQPRMARSIRMEAQALRHLLCSWMRWTDSMEDSPNKITHVNILKSPLIAGFP